MYSHHSNTPHTPTHQHNLIHTPTHLYTTTHTCIPTTHMHTSHTRTFIHPSHPHTHTPTPPTHITHSYTIHSSASITESDIHHWVGISTNGRWEVHIISDTRWPEKNGGDRSTHVLFEYHWSWEWDGVGAVQQHHGHYPGQWWLVLLDT